MFIQDSRHQLLWIQNSTYPTTLCQLADTVIILLRSQGSHNIQYIMYEKRMFTGASRSNFQRGITEADNREHRIDRGRKKKIRFMNLFSDRQNRLPGQFICRTTERKEGRPQTRKSFRLQSWPKKTSSAGADATMQPGGELRLANRAVFH